MAQENIYPFSTAGEDIQRLLPEHIGAAFKMVWDAPADSPEVLKQAGKQLALARKSARGASKKKVSDQDAVRESLRYLQLTRALNLIYRNRAQFHDAYQVHCLASLIKAGMSTGGTRRGHLQAASTELMLWWAQIINTAQEVSQ